MAIAISLEEELISTMMQVETLELATDAEIHLVHVVPTILYARGMHPSALTYPLPEERPGIEQAIVDKLKVIAGRLFPRNKNIVLRCLFGQNEQETFCDYLKEHGADFAVVATRGKHGIATLFDSSFAQYLCRYSPVPLIVLR